VPGELEYAGRGVSYCAVCDGAFFKGENLAVIGGGDAAVEEADYLTRYADKVHVVHRRDEFRASKIMQQRALDHEKIDVVWDTVPVEVIGADKKVTGLKVRNVLTDEASEISAGGVFVAIGHDPATKIFEGQLDMDDNGYILVSQGSRTNVDGVFAGGDCVDHVYRQAVTAAGMGCMAAIDAERWLEARAHGA
jgi:thioredoxin reductase (NADPH)